MTVRIEFVSFLPHLFCQWFWLCGSILQACSLPTSGREWECFPPASQSPVPPVCPAPLLMRVLPLVPCATALPFSWDWSRQPAMCSLSAFLLPPGLICFSQLSLGMACPTAPVTSALSDRPQLGCFDAVATPLPWLASVWGLSPSASLLILGCMMAALANCLLLSSKTLCAIKINLYLKK